MHEGPDHSCLPRTCLICDLQAVSPKVQGMHTMRSPSSFSVGEITRAAAKRRAISSAIRKHSAQTMSLSVLSARSFPLSPNPSSSCASCGIQLLTSLLSSCLIMFVYLCHVIRAKSISQLMTSASIIFLSLPAS